jgi:hypothetical protein
MPWTPHQTELGEELQNLKISSQGGIDMNLTREEQRRELQEVK